MTRREINANFKRFGFLEKSNLEPFVYRLFKTTVRYDKSSSLTSLYWAASLHTGGVKEIIRRVEINRKFVLPMNFIYYQYFSSNNARHNTEVSETRRTLKERMFNDYLLPNYLKLT